MVRAIAAAAAAAALVSTAFAQDADSPPRRDANAVVPVFRVTVVGRSTAAINYQPRSSAKVDLAGTPLMPQARGAAEVSAKKGYLEIDARVERMLQAPQFGGEYLTYVLWAITPEGRPKNLGEMQMRGDDAHVHATTELQAFALIVTAEPYFAVTQPSELVVLENVVRDTTNQKVEAVGANYDLLKRGSYLRNQGAVFTAIPIDPDTPLDLAEARNAIALARIAGADQYASESFVKATGLLAEAERALRRNKNSKEMTMAARQATQTAEDARLIAVQYQEQAAAARQRVASALRERDALDRAQVEETKRLEAERAAAAARAVADQERIEREHARRDAAQVQADAEQARLDALRLQAALAVAEQEKKELRERLRQQLNAILETRETARGLIMNVPDVLFVTGSSRLTAVAREKLARVGGILAAQPDLHVSAEGHTDNVGSSEENLRLSERRAAAVLAYLVEQKIPLTAVDTVGFGEARPIASNETAAGRQKNRRVELIVTGESIGRAAPPSAAGQ
jgi:outer membrane protein OmpA-like peptidoglycan-associated protein